MNVESNFTSANLDIVYAIQDDGILIEGNNYTRIEVPNLVAIAAVM